MTPWHIFDPARMKEEILASRERCLAYGLDPEAPFYPNQHRIGPAELEARRARSSRFFRYASRGIRDLFHLLEGEGFCVVLADGEGYVLDVVGDTGMLQVLEKKNCLPGYRWTERDVGPSAISIALARGIPVQITDREGFFARGSGTTNSAAPVFSPRRELLGVIAITGKAHLVHPHTLGMAMTAARAIENQIILKRQSVELDLRNRYMAAAIETMGRGFLAVNGQGVVTHVNSRGRAILGLPESLVGAPVAALFVQDGKWREITEGAESLTNIEVAAHRPGDDPVRLLADMAPIRDPHGEIRGRVLIFQELARVNVLAHRIAGTEARFTLRDIIGESEALGAAKALARQAARSRSTVLLTGETGTGKELFAQAIHNAGERNARPFVAIHCGAIPRELVESELFGYAEGAFTGARRGGRPGKLELAQGGTVFLDEIGDMPTEMQVKLLRFLQSGEICRIGEHKPFTVDVRVIAATNAALEKKIRDRTFREDFFYRLNVFPIVVPPIRDRGGDVFLLAEHFLGHFRAAIQRPGLRFSEESLALMRAYGWPGNVRELENAIERAANLAPGPEILPAHLGLSPSPEGAKGSAHGEGSRLRSAEERAIRQTLEETGCNIARAARLLGMSRPTLYAKMRLYGLGREAGLPGRDKPATM